MLCRGPEFGLKSAVTPVPGDLMPSSGLCGYCVHVVHRHTHRLNIHTRKIKINLCGCFLFFERALEELWPFSVPALLTPTVLAKGSCGLWVYRRVCDSPTSPLGGRLSPQKAVSYRQHTGRCSMAELGAEGVRGSLGRLGTWPG